MSNLKIGDVRVERARPLGVDGPESDVIVVRGPEGFEVMVGIGEAREFARLLLELVDGEPN